MLCLGCSVPLRPEISAFCYTCKAPYPLDWSTGNKSLDSFIMTSWDNLDYENGAYIQWIAYSELTNVQEMSPLRHDCTHVADWATMRVILKRIVDDFFQVN